MTCAPKSTHRPENTARTGSGRYSGWRVMVQGLAGHRDWSRAWAGMTLTPALARLRVLRQWGGVMDMSMDGSPIISGTPLDGLVLNGGWCYGGFKAIPAGGMTTAHLIAADSPHSFAAHLDLDRFAAGRTIDERGVGPYPYAH